MFSEFRGLSGTDLNGNENARSEAVSGLTTGAKCCHTKDRIGESSK